MYQQVSNGGAEHKHSSLRGDLVATSSPTGAYSPAPITDAFSRAGAGARWSHDSQTNRLCYRFTGTPQPSYSPPNDSATCSRNSMRGSSSAARGQW